MNAYDSWSRHQKLCLQIYKRERKLGRKDLRIAFPGSMLFNQMLLVDGSRRFACEPVTLSSLDVVFRYCGLMASGIESKDILVVCDDAAKLPGIERCISQIQDIDTINILSGTPDKMVDYLSEQNTHMSVNALYPDWSSIDALYKLFREAKHTVFVDSMRVMDAAFTGSSCTLIASDAFRQDLGFEYLQWNLQKIGCDVLDTQGVSLNPVTGEHFPFLVVENSAQDLERQIVINTDQERSGNVLFPFSQLNFSDEIITLPKQSVHDPLVRLGNKRSKLIRKLNKLSKDPRAFLEDSNNPLLKNLAKLLSVNRAR